MQADQNDEGTIKNRTPDSILPYEIILQKHLQNTYQESYTLLKYESLSGILNQYSDTQSAMFTTRPSAYAFSYNFRYGSLALSGINVPETQKSSGH